MEKSIPLFKVFMADEVGKNLMEVLYSGWIGEGKKVVEFERALSDYLGNKKLLTLNNGTSGLQLAYHMAQYTNEYKSYHNCNCNEIISTPITCTATNIPIVLSGARIVWADVDPITGSINPQSVEDKITDNTKGITMVHWGGNPCDIEKINNIAKRYKIKTIEDGAHAMGMSYKNKKIGNHSDYTMISFQAIKHITAGDGGLLLLKRQEDYARARLLRWYGIDRDNNEGIDLRCEIDVKEAGYKFHMNDINATIGLHNLKKVDTILKKHRENAEFYNEAFKRCSSITLVPENPDGSSSWWLYTIHVNNRDELMMKLNEAGVMASKVHARNDTHSMFKEFSAILPGADKFNRTHICIPVGWWLTKEDREYIAEKVLKYAQ